MILLIPLSLKRDMSAFRYVSMASIASLVYTAVVLILELPEYYKHYSETAVSKAAYIDLNLFTGCAMTFYSYTC